MKTTACLWRQLRRNLFITALIFTGGVAVSQSSVNFSSNIVKGCAPILVSFSGQSTIQPTEWKWDLGNGTFSNLQNPSVTYFNPGWYTIKLWVRNQSRQDSVIKTNYIFVSQPPVVDFTATNSNGCTPFSTSFQNNTTTAATGQFTWQWDFGDGLLSTQQSPSHNYTLSGNFTVTLKVTDTIGCIGTKVRPAYIKTNYVRTRIGSRIVTTCEPNNISFRDTTTGSGIIARQWDFGDGENSTNANPVHLYNTAGLYVVKLLVRNNFGCTDSAIVNVRVAMPVSAAFSADRLQACKPPLEVHFSSANITSNSYEWILGDTTSITGGNPVYNFTDTGRYSIRLIAKDRNGCLDTVLKTDYIAIQKPFVVADNLPDSGCLSFTKTFSATTIAGNVSSYLWDFGDGSTSVQPDPTHTFPNVGYYNMSLVVTSADGCKDTTIINNAIRVSTKPQANFSITNPERCAKLGVQFTNLSINSNWWKWDFGDNSYSATKNPYHMYQDTGWMTIKLVAKNGGCADTAIFRNYLYLKPAVAKFDFQMRCIVPMERTFRSLSIGATRWLWDFGDGTTSTERNPVHIFPAPGSYTVKLFAVNDTTGCDYTTTKRVKIINITPDLRASDTVICRGTATTFTTNATKTDVLRFYWIFGDGQAVTTFDNSVVHTYDRPGTYTVRLITLDSIGCRDTAIRTNYIKVEGPTAKFGVTSFTICNHAPVVFNDSSSANASNPIRQWLWDFGNGVSTTVTAPPFIYTYPQGGLFPVSLKLTDSKGCMDSFTLTPSLKVSDLTAKINLSDSVVCPGSAINFSYPLNPAGISFQWDFGDGTSSTNSNPTHSYTNTGLYSVKLKLTNAAGCADSISLLNGISVVETTADFTMSDSFRTCPPLLIRFTNHSMNATTETWYFGDSTHTSIHNPSHFYTYPGVYTITLVTSGPGGCVKTMQRQITVKGPTGTLTYKPLFACKPYKIDFKVSSSNAVSYIWDYNDGHTTVNADTVTTHIYQDSGSFHPKIILIDENNCRVAVNGRDTLLNIFVKSNFNFADSVFCGRGDVAFTNTTLSNDSLATYEWHFGDGDTSVVKNPVHSYLTSGIFYPELQVTSRQGCIDLYRSAKAVHISATPQLTIVSPDSGCVPLQLNFQAQALATDSIRQWQWSFGNGNTSNQQQPPAQLFATPGLYNVTLTGTNGTGCTKTIEKTIKVSGNPILNRLADTTICFGKQATLSLSGASRYQWWPSTGLSCDTCASTIASPLFTTIYVATVISAEGCSSKDTVSVKVQQPFRMTYTAASKLCRGESKQLTASGAANYNWWPQTGLNNPAIPAPVANPDTTTKYRVIGADAAGCFKDTGYVLLTVNGPPTVNAGEDKTISVGRSVDLEAMVSADVTTVQWSPTDGAFRYGDNTITVKPVQNTEYTVEVKNAGGCKASDKVKVIVMCNGTNLFIPTAFSPNNDGTNDIFYPRGVGLFKIKSLLIYNRWGQLVFEKKSFNANDAGAGWNGTFKGQRLNTDTFVYMMEVICDNNSVLSINGNITLVN